MNRKRIAVLLCCGAVAYACAPRNRSGSETDQGTKGTTLAQSTDSSGLALTIASTGERELSFAIEMRNAGKLTELRFPNGKTHDFVVLDERDREVWRWSDGRLFTQSIQTKQLKKGDALRYEAKWDTAPPGRYRVVASLNTAPAATPIEREFVVR